MAWIPALGLSRPRAPPRATGLAGLRPPIDSACTTAYPRNSLSPALPSPASRRTGTTSVAHRPRMSDSMPAFQFPLGLATRAEPAGGQADLPPVIDPAFTAACPYPILLPTLQFTLSRRARHPSAADRFRTYGSMPTARPSPGPNTYADLFVWAHSGRPSKWRARPRAHDPPAHARVRSHPRTPARPPPPPLIRPDPPPPPPPPFPQQNSPPTAPCPVIQ